MTRENQYTETQLEIIEDLARRGWPLMRYIRTYNMRRESNLGFLQQDIHVYRQPKNQAIRILPIEMCAMSIGNELFFATSLN